MNSGGNIKRVAFRGLMLHDPCMQHVFRITFNILAGD